MDFITEENYIFGFIGANREGLNHVLLELKKYAFYNWSGEISAAAFCEQWESKVRVLIIKEKSIAISNNRLEAFQDKWKNYTAIYDYRGSDLQIHS